MLDPRDTPIMSKAPTYNTDLRSFWHDPYPALKRSAPRKLDSELRCNPNH